MKRHVSLLIALTSVWIASGLGQTLMVVDTGSSHSPASQQSIRKVPADLFQTYCSFDGIDDYVRAPNAPCLNFGTDTSFTVEIWFRKTHNSEFDLLSKGVSSRGWRLYVGITYTDPLNPFGPTYLSPSGVGARVRNRAYHVIQNVFPIVNNDWIHLAFIADRDSAKTTLSLHRPDGTHRDWSTTFLLADSADVSASDCDLGLGYRPQEPAQSDWFKGDIAELRIWNHARTVSQLQATLVDTLPPAYYASADSGLVLYYRFDRLEDLGVGGQGMDIRDLSVHANHAAYFNGTTGIVGGSTGNVPNTFALDQNYPNPFNPSTEITYHLPEAGPVSLVVYDFLGRVVVELVREKRDPGTHTTRFDASGLASGVYFYRLRAGDFIQTRKMLLLR